eukprot:scaffold130694_cov69-Phaeocystis_antarctica.AAC.1
MRVVAVPVLAQRGDEKKLKSLRRMRAKLAQPSAAGGNIQPTNPVGLQNMICLIYMLPRDEMWSGRYSVRHRSCVNGPAQDPRRRVLPPVSVHGPALRAEGHTARLAELPWGAVTVGGTRRAPAPHQAHQAGEQQHGASHAPKGGPHAPRVDRCNEV